MPVYDYRCTSCDTRFEVSRPMGSSAEAYCPDCGCEAKRVYTPVGVAFKGSGFHNTDYKARPQEASSSSSCAAKESGSCASASS